MQYFVTRLTCRLLPAVLLAVAHIESLGAWAQQLPNRPGSFRFGVIGDSGTGGRAQYEVGKHLAKQQTLTSFQTVVMLGDNIYGRSRPQDYKKKFELPYKPLLDAGVKFYASLGNHDPGEQVSYELFNMGGERYYTFKPHDNVRFFSLDTTTMDKRQLQWLEKELAASDSDWKIVFFHHPIYSSGRRHGSDLALRAILEPMFVEYGVSLVLAGHDHFYERIRPQKGIHYFVIGGSAKLRSGNVRRTLLTAEKFDTDNSFTVMEIDKDTLYFQTISRLGDTVDSGSFERPQRLTGETATGRAERNSGPPVHGQANAAAR